MRWGGPAAASAVAEVWARRLATVETVVEVAPIPEADAIVRARIRGWDVVVKLGEFVPGDRCVYFEVDSLLDVADPRFAFLAPRGVRTDVEGRSGHVLKTARLRGQYSQGLALPLAGFPGLADAQPGTDVTAALGIVKWDPPIPAQLAGEVRGRLPSWIPVTDEERIQNMPTILAVEGVAWVATEKLDGTSCTVYVDPHGEQGVASRNLDLRPSETNTRWNLVRRHAIHAELAHSYPDQYAVLQGEIYGESIQGNPLKVRGQHFAAFTLRVGSGEVPRRDWPDWALDLSVPVRALPFPADVDAALAQVDGLTSALVPDKAAEGLVWRAVDAATVVLPGGQVVRASFKVVSNRYLLKHDR